MFLRVCWLAIYSARCPEDKESTKSKTETAESVDAGPSRIEGQERGAGAQSKKSKKEKTKKKKKKSWGQAIGTSTSARVLQPRTGRLKKTKTSNTCKSELEEAPPASTSQKPNLIVASPGHLKNST